jgi:hypothetical protein
MEAGTFQLSLVALGDRDPLERHQSYFLFVPFPDAVQKVSRSSGTPAMFLEISRQEMEAGAFQLSLVALGDRDPLERRQS